MEADSEYGADSSAEGVLVCSTPPPSYSREFHSSEYPLDQLSGSLSKEQSETLERIPMQPVSDWLRSNDQDASSRRGRRSESNGSSLLQLLSEESENRGVKLHARRGKNLVHNRTRSFGAQRADPPSAIPKAASATPILARMQEKSTLEATHRGSPRKGFSRVTFPEEDAWESHPSFAFLRVTDIDYSSTLPCKGDPSSIEPRRSTPPSNSMESADTTGLIPRHPTFLPCMQHFGLDRAAPSQATGCCSPSLTSFPAGTPRKRTPGKACGPSPIAAAVGNEQLLETPEVGAVKGGHRCQSSVDATEKQEIRPPTGQASDRVAAVVQRHEGTVGTPQRTKVSFASDGQAPRNDSPREENSDKHVASEGKAAFEEKAAACASGALGEESAEGAGVAVEARGSADSGGKPGITDAASTCSDSLSLEQAFALAIAGRRGGAAAACKALASSASHSPPGTGFNSAGTSPCPSPLRNPKLRGLQRESRTSSWGSGALVVESFLANLGFTSGGGEDKGSSGRVDSPPQKQWCEKAAAGSALGETRRGTGLGSPLRPLSPLRGMQADTSAAQGTAPGAPGKASHSTGHLTPLRDTGLRLDIAAFGEDSAMLGSFSPMSRLRIRAKELLPGAVTTKSCLRELNKSGDVDASQVSLVFEPSNSPAHLTVHDEDCIVEYGAAAENRGEQEEFDEESQHEAKGRRRSKAGGHHHQPSPEDWKSSVTEVFLRMRGAAGALGGGHDWGQGRSGETTTAEPSTREAAYGAAASQGLESGNAGKAGASRRNAGKEHDPKDGAHGT